MDLKIKDRIAVITGGDSGMGLATAKMLAAEGARIVLTDIDEEELQQAADEVRKLASTSDHVKTFTADLTDYEEVKSLAANVRKAFGPAHIVANFAGARGAAGDFLNLSDKDWMETINIDLMGAVRVARAFIPHMQENEWGRLIFVASENALQPYEEESPYNASKAGLINLSKCLSRAYSKDGLLINTVSPAYVKTPMTDAMMEQLAEERNSSVEEAVNWFLENKRPHIEVKRRGKPEEVAAMVAFLCSEHASYINGTNIRIDGGSVETAFG
ncbi:SDR family NAD(P)-dependent oxidoreductase [Roseivirga sp. BDSF3-8]|uniref:SDR family NAD(P)-dependent oxidoreductase n=1 Tax=Roseivirga sp. BDSF3-8 TaxID=3241598 RepID=UPI003531D68D